MQHSFIELFVRDIRTDNMFRLQVSANETISDWKQHIARALGIPVESQCLVFCDNIVKDNQVIQPLNQPHTIPLVIKRKLDARYSWIFQLNKHAEFGKINKKNHRLVLERTQQGLNTIKEAINVLQDILEGRSFALHLLDPHVGDCACQIRASILLDIIGCMKKVDLNKEKQAIEQLQQNGKRFAQFLELELHKKNSNIGTSLADLQTFFSNHPNFQLLYCDTSSGLMTYITRKYIAFLTMCYVCSVYQNRVNQDKTIISKWSVEYILNLCEIYAKCSADKMLALKLVKQVQGLESIPCFISGSLIWKNCVANGYQLFVEVKRFPRDSFEMNKFEYCLYKFIVQPSKKKIVKFMDEFPPVLHIHVDAVSAPYFSIDKMRQIEAIDTTTEQKRLIELRDVEYEKWIETELTFELFEDIYHSFFATHPQYPGMEDAEDQVLSQLKNFRCSPKNFEYYFSMKGACFRDATLVLFRHMSVGG